MRRRAAGQFAKNQLGDRNEFLPTVRGFGEFFGNLYHLKSEEEPKWSQAPVANDRFTFSSVQRMHRGGKEIPKLDSVYCNFQHVLFFRYTI